MIVSVSPDAQRELTDGVLYYERQGSTEVGLAFVAEFERAINVLGTHPELGAPWRNDRRRFPVRKFPYSIVYYVYGEEVRVIALAHHRRRPGYWADRE